MEGIKKYKDPAYTEEIRQIETGLYEVKRRGKKRPGTGTNLTPPKKKRKK